MATRISVFHGMMGASYVLGVSEDDKPLGHFDIRADVPFGDPYPAGWSARLGGLVHKQDITAEKLREMLPGADRVTWDEQVYGGAENAELRGRGDGLMFWLVVACDKFPKGPTDEEKEAARPRLQRLRSIVWGD